MYRPFESYSRTDQLINLAHKWDYFEQDERLEKLQATGKEIGGILLDGWEEDQTNTVLTLRDITAYACMPSLAATIQERPQSKAIAKQVTRNFRALYGYLLSSDIVHNSAVGQRQDRGAVRGQLSELAVLSTLWWGITNNQRAASSSVLPATQAQDTSQLRDGYRTAADIIVRDGDNISQYIQIKHSLWDRENIRSYYFDIPVITPSMLTHPKDRTPIARLCNALATNDVKLLRQANEQANHILTQERVPPTDRGGQLKLYIST